MTRLTVLSRCARRLVPVALLLSAACSTPAPTPDSFAPPTSPTSAPEPAVDRLGLRAELADHRALQIAHLHAYALAGQFPHNVTTAPSLHLFRDPKGRLCAVANLIQTDGRGDLVEATVLAQNDLAIADVHGGQMMEWIERSGLTQEELVRIQVPAPFLGKRMRPAEALPLELYADGRPTPPSPETQMNAEIAKHAAEVEAELRADTERSLDVAVERLVAAAGAARAARKS
jgi:hypothetical protein